MVAALGACLAPAAAYAADAPIAGADRNSNTVSANVSFSTVSNTTQTATITVPEGLVPTRISGLFGVPTSLTGQALRPGTVTMYAGSRKILERPAGPGRFTADINPSDVVEGLLTISLQYSVGDSKDDVCLEQGQIISLTDMAVTYSGTESTPKTVAQFLAPGVTAVNVVIPAGLTDKTDPLIQAGLSAVGALSYRFGTGVPVELSFGTPDQTVVGVPGSRIVSFNNGENPVHTSITSNNGVPQLNITGTGDALASAASALGSNQLPLAGAAVTSGLSQSGAPEPVLTQSLSDFSTPKPTVTGWGSHALFVGVQQSAFRGPISNISVHLVGTNTAMPTGVTATLNVYWNDFLIASQVLTEHTTVDVSGNVPDSVLTSNNGLKIEMTAIPPGGNCLTNLRLIPVGVYLDGEKSTITANRGQSIGPGFPRFPQALGENLPIAFGSGASAEQSAKDASLLVASLQLADANQLDVSLESFDDLASSSASGLFVGANEDDSNTLSAPLRLTQFRTVDSAVVFGVGIDQGYAALQAFPQNGRNLLMLGSWSPSEALDPQAQGIAQSLADYTYTTEGGWTSLSQDLLLGQVGTDPVELTTNAVTPQVVAVDEYRPYALWALLAFFALFAVGLLRLITTRRQRRKLNKYVDAQEAADAEAQGAPSP